VRAVGGRRKLGYDQLKNLRKGPCGAVWLSRDRRGVTAKASEVVQAGPLAAFPGGKGAGMVRPGDRIPGRAIHSGVSHSIGCFATKLSNRLTTFWF